MPYYVRIARFMPRVELVQKHNSTVRRLYIQGDNGKIYPFLVLNDMQVARCRSEERILQLFTMVNLLLVKDKVRILQLFTMSSHYHSEIITHV